MAQTKECSRCGLSLALTSFNKKSSAPDGLQYYCRECSRDTSRIYAGLQPEPETTVPSFSNVWFFGLNVGKIARIFK